MKAEPRNPNRLRLGSAFRTSPFGFRDRDEPNRRAQHLLGLPPVGINLEAALNLTEQLRARLDQLSCFTGWPLANCETFPPARARPCLGARSGRGHSIARRIRNQLGDGGGSSRNLRSAFSLTLAPPLRRLSVF